MQQRLLKWSRELRKGQLRAYILGYRIPEFDQQICSVIVIWTVVTRVASTRFTGDDRSRFASILPQHYVLSYKLALGWFGLSHAICEDERHSSDLLPFRHLFETWG
jgi:hypothetical protein